MSFPRYPKYKPSGVEWLGDVPEHWEVAPLRRLADFQNGADYKEVEDSSGYPVIGSGGPFAYASKFLFSGESVLFGRKGTVDRPLYVNGPFWTVDTMYWTRVRRDHCARWLYYAATTIPFSMYSTNTALPSMTQTVLGAHALAVPPSSEQHAIADFLDREIAKIDALVAEQERLIELLKEKRQAAISHAVTKGLDPNAPMKDSGIEWLGEIPAHWDLRRLKRISPRISGRLVYQPAQYFGDEGVPFLMGNNVTQQGIRWEDVKLIPAHVNQQFAQHALREGDVITVRVGAPGVTCVVPKDADGLNCGSLMIIRRDESYDSAWLAAVMNSPLVRAQIDRVQYGAAQEQINITDAVDFIVPTPPLHEQAHIVRAAAAATALFSGLATQAERAAELLLERRAALISAAVTGQIDVRGVSATA